MTNQEKTLELKKQYYDMVQSIGGHALDHVLLDMASWKDDEFMNVLVETNYSVFADRSEYIKNIQNKLNIE